MPSEPNRDPRENLPPPAGPNPDHVNGDQPPADADEMELTAYLDGELDPSAARRVEDRLKSDPQVRSRAEALKKTYDLLDYLPQPEPSPTFASRTLERLPVVRTSHTALQPAPARPSSSTPIRTPISSSTAPLTLSSSGSMAPSARGWSGPWAIGGVLAVIGAVAAGYFGNDSARTYLFPPTDSALSLEDDRRLIRNLPLYAAVDDYDFLVRLAESDTFVDDAEQYADLDAPSAAIVQEASEPPWKEKLAPLIRAFKALPAGRRAQLRDLDRRLNDQPQAEKENLVRVLEAYAVWLAQLPEAERKAVLGATNPNSRLIVIRDIREDQWKARLPEEWRKQLQAVDPDKRAELIQKWKDEETERRRAWLLARKNWETIRNDRVPWPFDSEPMKKEVADFVRSVLKMEGASHGRLTIADAERLRNAHAQAAANGAWLWYGFVVREMAEKYPTLPPPLPSAKAITDIKELPKDFDRHIGAKKTATKQALRLLAGRWPEFGLAVVEDARKANVHVPSSLFLGPSKIDDYAEPVRNFYTKTLEPKLSHGERDALHALEGKWPEHPRKLLELAKKYDLPVPGVTLPGPPSHWDKTYRVPMGGAKIRP